MRKGRATTRSAGKNLPAGRHALGQLGQFYKGGGLSKSDLAECGIPCLRYAEIYTMYRDVIHCLRSHVAEETADGAFPIEHGDVIFAASGETAEDIGKAVAYLGKGRAVVGGDTVVLRGHGQDPSYLAHALNANDAVRQKARLGKGQSIVHIHAPDLSKVEVWLAPVTEQRRIAAILRTWDDGIEKVERLIAHRAEQYLGLRDKLIDWSSHDRTALGAFLRPVSRPVPRPNDPYRALGIRSHGKGTFSRFVDKPDDVDMDTLYVAKAGDIIVNITFAWEGAVALVPPEHDGGLVSHRFPTFVPDARKANARYLRHALRMPRFTYLLGVVSPGGAGRNRVLSKRDLLDLEIPLPSFDNQARIAAILDDAENAIASETGFRDALIRQKHGLVQKLLTGEWRVKVDSKKEVMG
ncbi:MAG TPA: hypothetical protein VHE09_01930 [Rhizomicrobium sp.]|nr:hypothetical protein [Rhizomicrobium sp.]